MQVFDNKFETVNFLENIQLFEAIWKKESENMVDKDYRNEIEKQFAFIATKKVRFVLFETHDFYFTIEPDTQAWNNEIIVKHFHEAGVEKAAIVLAQNIFSEMSVQQTMEETSQVNFVTRSFGTKEDAMAWFTEKA